MKLIVVLHCWDVSFLDFPEEPGQYLMIDLWYLVEAQLVHEVDRDHCQTVLASNILDDAEHVKIYFVARLQVFLVLVDLVVHRLKAGAMGSNRLGGCVTLCAVTLLIETAANGGLSEAFKTKLRVLS